MGYFDLNTLDCKTCSGSHQQGFISVTVLRLQIRLPFSKPGIRACRASHHRQGQGYLLSYLLVVCTHFIFRGPLFQLENLRPRVSTFKLHTRGCLPVCTHYRACSMHMLQSRRSCREVTRRVTAILESKCFTRPASSFSSMSIGAIHLPPVLVSCSNVHLDHQLLPLVQPCAAIQPQARILQQSQDISERPEFKAPIPDAASCSCNTWVP